MDWWALGVLLVETCQGKTPFRSFYRLVADKAEYYTARGAANHRGDDEKFRSAVEKLLHKRASRRLRSAAQLAKRRFFEPLDFQKLERKELEPPFTPRAGWRASRPDQNLVKKFVRTGRATATRPSKRAGPTRCRCPSRASSSRASRSSRRRRRPCAGSRKDLK